MVTTDYEYKIIEVHEEVDTWGGNTSLNKSHNVLNKHTEGEWEYVDSYFVSTNGACTSFIFRKPA